MEIAQATLAVLDIGLDLVPALAGPSRPLIPLGHFGVDELPRGALHHLRAEALFKFGKELRVAKDQARIEKRGADGHVGLPILQTLVDGARRVADLEAKIPEQIENVLGDTLSPRGLLVWQQKEQIDVGTRRQQTAPVAAGRHDGHTLGVRRIGCAIDVPDRVVIDQADQLILEQVETGRAAPPVAVNLECSLGRVPCIFHDGFQAFENLHPRFG